MVVIAEVALDERLIIGARAFAPPLPVAPVVEGGDQIDVPITQLGKQLAHHEEERVGRHRGAQVTAVLVVEVTPGGALRELEVEVAIATVEDLPEAVIVGIRIRRVLALGGTAREREEEAKRGEELSEVLHIRRAQGSSDHRQHDAPRAEGSSSSPR